jgi:hypothetical protein
MISELDIWRAANLLIRRHGADAELESARFHDLMLDSGDDEGRLVWARIGRAIEGAAGAAGGQAKLKPRRAPMVRDAWDGFLDLAIAAWLGLLDRVAPMPETAVDRAIREEGERLRRAFPWLDERRRLPSGRVEERSG